MTLRHLGIIGAGSIATELLGVLARSLPAPLERVTVLGRSGRKATAEAALAGTLQSIVSANAAAPGPADQSTGPVARKVDLVEDFTAFLASRPDLVLECAGHEAVREHAPSLLSAGIDTVVVSTGALADAAVHAALEQAARDSGAQLTIPAGAVGGMDILGGVRHADVARVTYVSRKPPGAWKGTPAEQAVDLDALTGETAFYEGTARQAALDYPKNANVAATIALCGIGFEKTRVRLVADPAVTANVHAFEVISDAAEFTVRIEGKPSPANPKTSLPTVYSLVREVMRRVEPIKV